MGERAHGEEREACFECKQTGRVRERWGAMQWVVMHDESIGGSR